MASILNSLVGLDNNSDFDQENLTASTAATKKNVRGHAKQYFKAEAYESLELPKKKYGP